MTNHRPPLPESCRVENRKVSVPAAYTTSLPTASVNCIALLTSSNWETSRAVVQRAWYALVAAVAAFLR